MPAVSGLIFVGSTNFTDPEPLSCLADLRAVAPDGSIVYEHDRFAPHHEGYYRIIAVSPPPGTPVGRKDSVTVTVARIEPAAEKPVYHPCDWVSPSQAAALLDSPTVDIPPPLSNDTWRGSTFIGCHYNSGDESYGVSTDLEVANARIVDAEAEFAFYAAQLSSVSIDGVGIKAACTPDPRQPTNAEKHRLYALLPGGRMFVVSGFGGVSCDTLKEFAQTAIPRIDI